jgi:protein-disulfide isomerase
MTVRAHRIGALLVAAGLCLAIVTGVGASISSPGTALVDGIPQRGTVIGQVGANVTLIQFEDLGCSHCAEYMKDAFPTIINDYVRTGRVKVDFRGLGVVTPASAPALRYTLAASRQKKLWQVAELFYENQSRLNELATDKGVKRMVSGVKGLNATLLVADSKTVSVKKQAAAHAAEATRRNVPGTPWFFVKIGTAAPKVVRPEAYDGESFSAILDDALGR